MTIYTRTRQNNAITGALKLEVRSYPVSCANRTFGAWSTISNVLNCVGEKHYMYDEVTSDYWKRRRSGEWIPPRGMIKRYTLQESIGDSSLSVTTNTPLACTLPDAKYVSEYRGKHFGTNYFSGLSGSTVTYPALTDLQKSSLVRQVATKCMADRQKGKANYVETLAELDKTYAMLKSPLDNVNKFLTDFTRHSSYKRLQRLRRRAEKANRKVNFSSTNTPAGRDASIFLALLSSEYLRFRYGISPLMGDVKAAMKALETGWSKVGRLVTSKAMESRTGHTYFQQSQTFGGIYELKWTESHVNTYSVKAAFTDFYKPTPFDYLGISFHNIVGVPWELTRLSFVVDWFVNVGDVIYANIPRVGIEPRGGYLSTYDKSIDVYAPTSFKSLSATYTISGASSDIVRITNIIKTRTPQLEEHVGFAINADFRFDNWTRVSDAIALITQQLQQIRL